MSAKWYEDVEPGERFATGGIVVTESHVMGFAGLTGDFLRPARGRPVCAQPRLPGRVAHGFSASRSWTDSRIAPRRAFAPWHRSAGTGSSRAILIGDRIHAEIEVQSKRETRRADRGILVLAFKVKNQNGEVVQEGTNDLMVLRKP